MDESAEAWLHVRELKGAGDVDGLIALLVDPAARASAARALGELGDARAVEPVARLLRASDFDARSAAASALGALGNPAAIPLLLDAIGDPHEAAKRIRLGPTWRRFLRHPLHTLDQLDEDADARGVFESWVLDALAQLHAREAVGAFLVLLRSEDRGLRVWAAESLARIGDPSAVDALRSARAREPLHRRRPHSRAIKELQRRPESSSARP